MSDAIAPWFWRVQWTTGNRRYWVYDAPGDTTSFTGDTFFFNQRGRMSSATVGGISTTYVYSALRQMIKQTVGSTTTLFMYDEAGHLLGEYEEASFERDSRSRRVEFTDRACTVLVIVDRCHGDDIGGTTVCQLR